jgi:hypothetical protein
MFTLSWRESSTPDLNEAAFQKCVGTGETHDIERVSIENSYLEP